MELTPRKQEVLRAIIKAYIKTGEPIGSKNLMAVLENAPSSATLRNEMNELCSLGLLEQPHTSAGRVPTSNGYRLYVEMLMGEETLSEEIKKVIDAEFSYLNCEPEAIPARAAELLSKLTGLPAVSCLITERMPRIKKVEFLTISRLSVMMLIVTDDGRTRNRILRHAEFTQEQSNCFNELLRKRVIGRTVNELTKAYMQTVVAEAGLMALEFMPRLTAVFEMACEIEATRITLSGENTLYNICADENTAKKIKSLINSRDPIISLLEGIGDNVGAVFGADTTYHELKKETIIAAKFSGEKDKYKGYVGIIGPNRMSYEQIMACTKYIAEKLTLVMTQAQKDMED